MLKKKEKENGVIVSFAWVQICFLEDEKEVELKVRS